MSKKGLIDRLANGGTIICAEGYLLEFERRGYLQCGGFIPEVVLEQPEKVQQLHEEFVNAGSDVVEAFTYFGHRAKLRAIGREDDLEKLNRDALRMARTVASAKGCLMAGNICNTGIYDTGDYDSKDEIMNIFKEQVEWAVEEGADYIIGETYKSLGESKMALEAIQKYGRGLPAVITIAPGVPGVTSDGIPLPDACRELEKAGAAVVGLNCGRGPSTMMPLIKEIRKVCKGPIAAMPVPYQTDDRHITWWSLRNRNNGARVYPLDLQAHSCTRSEIRAFAEEAKAAGVQYIGLCCGNASHYIREVAEIYGRKPPASKYSPEMKLSSFFSNDESGKSEKVQEAKLKMKKHLAGEDAL